MTKTELKKIACDAIDQNREAILSLGERIASEPELGFKEFKTAAKIQAELDKLGIAHRDGVAITGIVAPIKGRQSKRKLAIMGELDAIIVPNHPAADPETGAAHCCGHHVQSSAVIGVAYAFAKTDLMKYLDGDVVLMFVPAEEGVELEYRSKLKEEGKLSMLGGKPEFIVRGELDSIDILLMQHTACTEGKNGVTKKVTCGGKQGSLGVIAKTVRYIGKEAHGAKPYEGINALNAAELGLMGIHAQRETFRDEDNIRIHPIITKGGDLVNVVPADVHIETYVRGANNEAIADASMKVNRALQAGAMAVGATCEITEMPICMSPYECDPLKDLCYENLRYVFGDEIAARDGEGCSTEWADVSNLMPSVHMMIGGASGGLHGNDFCITNPDMAFLGAAKTLICSAIDLLADEAELADKICEGFTPAITKEEYLRDWCGIR